MNLFPWGFGLVVFGRGQDGLGRSASDPDIGLSSDVGFLTDIRSSLRIVVFVRLSIDSAWGEACGRLQVVQILEGTLIHLVLLLVLFFKLLLLQLFYFHLFVEDLLLLIALIDRLWLLRLDILCVHIRQLQSEVLEDLLIQVLGC